MTEKTFWLVYELFKLWTSLELAYKFQQYQQLLVHCLVWKCISFVLVNVLQKQLKNLKDKRTNVMNSQSLVRRHQNYLNANFLNRWHFSMKKQEISMKQAYAVKR